MADIYIVGGSDFTLGFYLTGIRNIKEISHEKDAERTMSSLIADPNVGLVVTDENTMSMLKPDFRRKLTSLTKPIVIILSENESSQDNLREMIKKSIGVDLWKTK